MGARLRYHANVGVVAEAGLADDGEVGPLPPVRLRVPQQPVGHLRLRRAAEAAAAVERERERERGDSTERDQARIYTR